MRARRRGRDGGQQEASHTITTAPLRAALVDASDVMAVVAQRVQTATGFGLARRSCNMTLPCWWPWRLAPACQKLAPCYDGGSGMGARQMGLVEGLILAVIVGVVGHLHGKWQGHSDGKWEEIDRCNAEKKKLYEELHDAQVRIDRLLNTVERLEKRSSS